MRILVVQGAPHSELISGEVVVIASDIDNISRHCEVRYELIRRPVSLLNRLVGITWSFQSFNRVLRAIDEHSPDVVHFHTTFPYLSVSVLFAAWLRRIPIVQSLHNCRYLCVEGGLFRRGGFCNLCVGNSGVAGVFYGCGYGRIPGSIVFLINFALRTTGWLNRNVSRFIAVSRFVEQQHVVSGFDANKVVTIENAVDPDTLNLARLPASHKKGIVFTGRVSLSKGSAILERLITSIDHEITIIGNGPELNDLKSLCDYRGYTHVFFTGLISHFEAIQLVRRAAITVVPSQCGDSFPTSAIESLAVGTPVVACAVGGLTGLIERSGAGLVIPSNDTKQFTQAVRGLYVDVELRESMAVKGCEYVKRNLHPDQRTQKLMRLYREVSSKSKAKRSDDKC